MSVAEVHDIAVEYVDAGLSIVPIRLDGTKSPAVPSWTEYQNRLPTRDEIDRWFSRPAGIAIIGGRISGGLEILDFDQWELFEPWRSLTTGINEYLPIVETGGGGYHVLYRCREIAGNTKLASWEPADCYSHREAGTRRGCNGAKVSSTRIETRGEGGYIVAPGSPLEVHKSGDPYVQVAGPVLPEIPTITPESRRALWAAATSFDCGKWESTKVAAKRREIKRERWGARAVNRPSGDATPWDDFDRRADWAEILEPHGWTMTRPDRWAKPGKPGAVHASINPNANGERILTVFSTKAAPLSPGSYGPFRAFAALNHGGDGRAAARELRSRGYGSRGDDRDVDLSGIERQPMGRIAS